LVERLGGEGRLLRILKHHPRGLVPEATRAYLNRFGIERSLVPAEDDSKLKAAFCGRTSPLRLEHLQGKIPLGTVEEDEAHELVEEDRTLRDYAEAGVDVRLTRANYRTGRLEISAYLSPEDFARYLHKQHFRWERQDPQSLPLGTFRLQLPGNPNAIAAALASGRFPGVLAPYPVEQIYPQGSPENSLIHGMLSRWLGDPAVRAKLSGPLEAVYAEKGEKEGRWARDYERWAAAQRMREFFPMAGDVYVDGGAIDNTPSNSAIDATREWADCTSTSRQEFDLDLYVVFLSTEPKLDPGDLGDPALHEVLLRTLAIQSAAKQPSDAVVVDTINTFGKRAQKLGDALQAVLQSYQEAVVALGEEQSSVLVSQLQVRIKELRLSRGLGHSSQGLLEDLGEWAEQMLAYALPVQVTMVNIYPDEMPMTTLQFTERLGYQQDNALKMLTMGCYQTLSTLRTHLEARKRHLDQQDEQVLAMTRKWMGEEPAEDWRCQRAACVFHALHCAHGFSGA